MMLFFMLSGTYPFMAKRIEAQLGRSWGGGDSLFPLSWCPVFGGRVRETKRTTHQFASGLVSYFETPHLLIIVLPLVRVRFIV